MRKVLITVVLIIGFVSATFGQTVNGVDLKSIDVEYVQIVGTQKGLLSNKVIINLDFGQHVKYFNNGKQSIITDENGEKVIFNSMMDALNFMTKYGYSFINSNMYSIGNQRVAHFMLKKD